MKRFVTTMLTAALILGLTLCGPNSVWASDHKVLLKAATENSDFTRATLPILQGRSNGQTVWYVVTDSSDRDDANRRQVNFSPKLENAKGTPAVQKARIVNGLLEFPATVDFSPTRTLVPSSTGFPPLQASPGAIGQPGYSPLVELPDGTVLNASHIQNGSGTHDKVISIDTTLGRATFGETEGFYESREVYYVSFDSSDATVATMEAATWAPNLNAAPGLGSNERTGARAGIIPFVNGQTGVTNPNRQGLNSALLGEGFPLNILQEIPDTSGRPLYSPLWDVHATEWTPDAIFRGLNVRQEDFDLVVQLARDGIVTGPGSATWGAVGIIVNCPAISVDKK